MANAVTFSVTAVGKNGAQGSLRQTVSNLQKSDLEDLHPACFDSYAVLSGEALPATHTTPNAALPE